MAAIDDILRAYGIGGSTLPGGPNPVRSGLGLPTPERRYGLGLPTPPIGGTLPGIPNPTPNPNQPYPQPPNQTPTPQQPVPMPGSPPNLPPSHHTGSGDNPYGDFNTSFGTGRNLYDTLASKKIGQINPMTEWTRMTSMSGFGGNNRKGQFGTNQGTKWNNTLQAALLNNPDLQLRDFAKATDPMGALNDQWLRASANARGLNPAARSSTIRWG